MQLLDEIAVADPSDVAVAARHGVVDVVNGLGETTPAKDVTTA